MNMIASKYILTRRDSQQKIRIHNEAGRANVIIWDFVICFLSIAGMLYISITFP